jgi:hypothetical protein
MNVEEDTPMNEIVVDDPPEFTDEQMREALRRMGEQARTQAFDAGLAVTIVRNGRVIPPIR